jgi:hypothetical protein
MNKGENSLVVGTEMGIGGDHEVELVHCLLVCLEESWEKGLKFKIDTIF